MSLFVGNLSPHVQHRELENAFRRFGRSNLELKDGYGFVIYEEHRDAERALRALQGRFVCGERLSLSWARKHRPFQRFSVKGNPLRHSWDKDQGEDSRRRPSLESDKRSDDDKKEYEVSTAVKNGSRVSEPREDASGNITREEWKDQESERPTLEDEAKDLDPLDSGRWGEPLSDGSAEHILGDGMRDYEDIHDDKEREDIKGSLHEKSQRYPIDKSFEHSSRAFWNSGDQYKRRRDVLGKPQERCFNCGQLGHVMRQCRSRNIYHRDGFDGRRTQFRNLRIGFRGMGGRYRGMDGQRRVFNRDMEGSYGRRILRRQSSRGDRSLQEQPDTKSYNKSRHRHHRSDSENDSASIERSKKKHKKSSKKSSRSARKRKRSSSDSRSASRISGSSSASPSCSRSRSRSRSRSAASRSLSSRSSSSRSHSCQSQSESSRSRSLHASSRSMSRSGSSRSRKLPSKYQSQTSKSRSRSVSHSHSPPRSLSRDSCGLPSQSPNPVKRGSPSLHSNFHEESKSHKNGSVAATYTLSTRGGMQKKQVSKTADESETQETDGSMYALEDHVIDEQCIMRKERNQHGFRESKKQKDRIGSDVEEVYYDTEKLSNNVNCSFESIKNSADKASFYQKPVMNEGYSRNYPQQDQNVVLPVRSAAGQVRSGVSEEPSSLLTEVVQASTYNAYVAVRKEGRKGVAYDCQGLLAQSFGAARLWPWEEILHRRLKRGPISTANYERRKLQNEEFGIEDKFVRSSSGWWEKHPE